MNLSLCRWDGKGISHRNPVISIGYKYRPPHVHLYQSSGSLLNSGAISGPTCCHTIWHLDREFRTLQGEGFDKKCSQRHSFSQRWRSWILFVDLFRIRTSLPTQDLQKPPLFYTFSRCLASIPHVGLPGILKHAISLPNHSERSSRGVGLVQKWKLFRHFSF